MILITATVSIACQLVYFPGSSILGGAQQS